MEKDFIPYQEALVLKELGFNEPCIGWATKEYVGVMFCGNRFKIYHEDELPTKPFGVPLYQQAFRWFRDKHDSYSYVSPDEGIYKMHDKSYGYTINTNSHDYGYHYGFTSYEEAELACLRKLIEIVKTNTA